MLRGAIFLAMGAAAIAATTSGCQPGTGPTDGGGQGGDRDGAAGQVTPDCSSDDDCGGDTCCDGECANLAYNALNCDGCGNACAGSESCFEGSCRPAAFAGLCDGKGLIRVSNGLPNDDQAGGVVATAIEDACGLSAQTVPQNDGEISDATGALLPGTGEIVVVTGGIYVSSVALSQETSGLSPIYFSGNEAGGGFYDMDTGDVIATWETADVSTTHDFFAVTIAPDPVGSRFVVTAAGAEQAGTKAAARYFADVIAPDLRSHARRYYVVEWTDGDDDGQPSAGDGYDVLGEG